MSTPTPEPSPALVQLDTTAQAPSGAGEPVRDLAALAARLLEKRAALTAAVVGVVTAVGSVLVISGLATGDDVDRTATAVGGVLTSLGALAAVVVPLLGAKSAGTAVRSQAEVVRADVVPVAAVAAYAPADPGQDVALGPAAGVLDAVDPEQP